MSDDDLANALRFGDRTVMRDMLDATNTEIVIPSDHATTSVVYSPDDEAFIRNTLARYLRHDFGYGSSVPRVQTPAFCADMAIGRPILSISAPSPAQI
jgi:hypothetical protein